MPRLTQTFSPLHVKRMTTPSMACLLLLLLFTPLTNQNLSTLAVQVGSEIAQSHDAIQSPPSPQGWEAAAVSGPNSPQTSPSPSASGHLVLVYGDYVNESGQEPTEVWEELFTELGYSTTTCHISDLQVGSGALALVVLPSVATSSPDFAVTSDQARAIVSAGPPVLLLGYAHEVLDRLWGFDPVDDFILCLERYMWTDDPDLQVFSRPHLVPGTNGQMDIYSDKVSYEGYRVSRLPARASVLGHNFGGSGAQLLWFRALTENPHIYWWGLDQAAHLNTDGKGFTDNLLRWILRPSLAERLGTTIAGWQLFAPEEGGYWAVQGAGGFGYPLEPSISFTYYVADLVVSHSLEVNTSSFWEWLFTFCYNSSLGCFEDLASPLRGDRCITTGMAVLTAQALGRINELEGEKVGGYLASCQDPATGGFLLEPGATKTSLQATYFALAALKALNQLDKVNVTAAVTYVASCQELDPQSPDYGGFYESPDGGFACSLTHSLEAIETLSLLEAMEAVNQSALLTFIAGCEEPPGSGIFDTRRTLSGDYWTTGTGCALRLLQLVGALESFNVNGSRSYLLDNQFADGGWGCGDSEHDFHDSPEETWYGALGLAVTGGLGDAAEGLTSYLSSCLTKWGGATEPDHFGDFLTSWMLTAALREAGGIGAINRTAFTAYLNNCWITTLSSFGWHQSPPEVSRDTDTPTPDRSGCETATYGPLYHYAFAQLVELLKLNGTLWEERKSQVLAEIESSQTLAPGYRGMFGLNHLYVGRESDFTFRFDYTCWSLLAHQQLGGSPQSLLNATAALTYLQSCLYDNGSVQYFHDTDHTVPLPAPWRAAGGHLADTWLGLQAYAYLDPSLSGLNGTRLTAYAAPFLENVTSPITAFYAADLLLLLKELGLNPQAPFLINCTALEELLLACESPTGLFDDPEQPAGRWTPYVTSLALQLASRLDLLPSIDTNPQLTITLLTYPTGTLWCGDQTTIVVAIGEERWGLLPDNVTVTASIFGDAYTNFTGPASQNRYNRTLTIPSQMEALGLQNLTVMAEAPRYLPAQAELTQICEVWGALASQTSFTPSLKVPRGTPLNVTLNLTLEGGTSPVEMATATITNLNTSDTFQATHMGGGCYEASLPTEGMTPGAYQLRISATAPYCVAYTEIVQMVVCLYATRLELESESGLMALDETAIAARLVDENGTGLAGQLVTFQLFRPGEADPWVEVNGTTNSTGLATYTWRPGVAGIWEVHLTFPGCDPYGASWGVWNLPVDRRPVTCTASLEPQTVFAGNRTRLSVEVTDGLNATPLPGLLVSFYDDGALLAATQTDGEGRTRCEWTAAPPLGIHTLQVVVAETAVYAGQTPSSLPLLVRETPLLLVANYSSSLYPGEEGSMELEVATGCGVEVNGTASLYWDGEWLLDFPIAEGRGTTTFTAPIKVDPGVHRLAILFGHLDDPDIYEASSVEVSVQVLAQLRTSLSILLHPGAVVDPASTSTLTVETHLTYHNGSSTEGLVGNVTLQLLASNASLLLEISTQTDSDGMARWIITLPPPGYYTLVVRFPGSKELSPATATASLVVRGSPSGPAVLPLPPLTLLFLAATLGGLAVGGVGFLRIQRRADRMADMLLGRGVTESQMPSSPEYPLMGTPELLLVRDLSSQAPSDATQSSPRNPTSGEGSSEARSRDNGEPASPSDDTQP